MLTEDYIIEVYCIVDEIMKKNLKKRVRERGTAPELTDEEVITMEIAGETMGMDKDTAIHAYFKNHWSHFFPKLMMI